MEHLKKSKVKFGCILVSDLKTGNILSIVEANTEKNKTIVYNKPVISLSAEYPSASVIKIITATAAVENNIKYVYEDIPHGGPYHIFIKKRFLFFPIRLKDKVSLEYAFANSINLSFGLVGNEVGYESLEDYAKRFGFNKKSGVDNIATSNYVISPDSMEIAMSSSGFTKNITMSPVHALEIGRALGDDGYYKYSKFYEGQKTPTPRKILRDSSLAKIQSYMQATVEYGTAQGGFDRTIKNKGNIVIGGKTGNLNGDYPVGRYTWFVGYAKNGDEGIAIAVMILNQRKTKTTSVKTSAVAIKNWFKLN
jgi:cell division protein FtsI/penicillin-binding protein 2